MIIVRVELLSAITGKHTELARMNICNIGGTESLGDYHCETLRGRNSTDLDQRKINRTGKVSRHRRKELHVWHLVGRALAVMGYAK
jgi:hypothetical protein